LELEERWRRKYRIELETERFRLRPLRDEDVDWITGLCMDPDVNRFLWECCTSVEKARRTAEAIVYLDLNKYHFGHWAIQDKQTGVIHGWTELGKLRPWCDHRMKLRSATFCAARHGDRASRRKPPGDYCNTAWRLTSWIG